MLSWTVAIVVGLILVVGAALAWPVLRRRRDERRLGRARQKFHRRREWLEARFLTLASQSGKPRGLTWTSCDFEDQVAFARDADSGQLRAFVGVAVSFEAVQGGEMEHVEAVGNLRAATAVFYWDGQDWTTDGRAIFNLNPAQAIKHFRHKPETVE